MVEAGAASINAIGALFFILAAIVSRYTPLHGSDMSEFWTGFRPAMFAGTLYATTRTVHRLDVLPDLLALIELVTAVVTAAVFMVVGIVWAITASREARIKESWHTSEADESSNA